MGTIGDQPPRPRRSLKIDELKEFLAQIGRIAAETGIKGRDVLQAAHVMELARQNDIAVDNGDYRDEHIAGLSDAIKEIADAIHEHK